MFLVHTYRLVFISTRALVERLGGNVAGAGGTEEVRFHVLVASVLDRGI